MKKMQLAVSLLLVLAGTHVLAVTEKNGFDLSSSLVPTGEILAGGPPRDGIPAIDRPNYVAAAKAQYLKDTDLVLGLVHNGIARAYPIRVLVWHEIVNAEFDGEPVVVTFCPLCGTGLAFSATVGNQNLDFGVSGLLHNSDLLMYDRQTDSLWSQIPGRAVTGKMAGTELKRLPVVHLPWKEWQRQYPDSEVLSLDTGSNRDYSRDPYAGYDRTERLFFPVSKSDRRYSRKTWVLGLQSNGVSKVWPFPELAKTGGKVMDTFAGQPVVIRYDAAQSTASAHDADGNLLPAVRAYWFAWYGFYPDTEVYKAEP
ncbi:Uncharacterised protein [Halioglobus japonicus]|nr:Uncharacterised protein [Halioglobus japonicus]